MKKHILLNIFIIIVIIAAAFLLGANFQKNEDEAQKALLLSVQNEQNEKSNKTLNQPWVNKIPGTTSDMLSPDYWKNDLSGELLFTEDEIKEYQKNNPLYVAYFDEPEGRTLKLRMYDLPNELKGYMVKALTNPDYIDERLNKTVTTYVNGRQPDKNYWSAIKNNCAFDLIPETVVPRYCVCVKRDLAMLLPTEDFASDNAEEKYCNDFISAEVMPFTGVVSLHESKDKKWCFVINGSYCGWVKKESLAYCTNREQWLNAVKPDNFLTVTACEMTLDETALPSKTAGLTLPMGTKIKLLKNFDKPVFGRKPYDCYAASLPCRDKNGALDFETVLIPVSKDVVVGNLSMTSEAVIRQAFKFLGKVYGWGGSFSSNDCSGIIRQVYACFGFELPRNSTAIANLFDLGGRDCKHMTVEKKRDILKKMPAGTLLYMEGHLMIYLGMADNKPYVLSSCASFIAPEDETKTVINSYGVFVSNMELRRKDGKMWLESMSCFQWKEY